MRYAEYQAASIVIEAVAWHFYFLASNPPATCFADAYQADMEAGNALMAAARALADPASTTDLSVAEPVRIPFVQSLDSYFSDCQ